MRGRQADRARALIDALNAIADALRSGASLRQAFAGPAGEVPSPFEGVASALAAGRPLVQTLHASARDVDPDVATACCVLAVHAEAGGDPLPAVRSLGERIAQRQHAREEARALTTQARLGARTILLLTPAFFVLVALSDPGAAIGSFTDPRIRLAVAGGIVLQAFGAWWIAAIIANATGSSSRSSRVPVVRALRAVLAGRAADGSDERVAATADVVCLVLEAGLSPTAAVRIAAPYAAGDFGVALRQAVAREGEPLADTLRETLRPLGCEAADRFARALASSTELGVPVAPSLRALADDIRGSERVRIAADIRRASVRVLVPLGVLVLPAFVLACLVPLFVGGLDGITGG